MISLESMAELVQSFRKSYDRDYPLINALANNNIPIPIIYKTTFEYVLNADLIEIFQSDKINIKEMERIVGELAKWNFKIEDPSKVSQLAGESIFKELKRISSERENLKRIQRLNRMFPLLQKFKLEPNFHKSQNFYFEFSQERKDETPKELDAEWEEQFKLLGKNLGVKLE